MAAVDDYADMLELHPTDDMEAEEEKEDEKEEEFLVRDYATVVRGNKTTGSGDRPTPPQSSPSSSLSPSPPPPPLLLLPPHRREKTTWKRLSPSVVCSKETRRHGARRSRKPQYYHQKQQQQCQPPFQSQQPSTLLNLPFVPPQFNASLNDPRPLQELQTQENLIAPADILEVDTPTGTIKLTMLLLTHSETRLGYSYTPVDLVEEQLVGIGIMTREFDSPSKPVIATTSSVINWCDDEDDDNQDNDNYTTKPTKLATRGLILRKNRRGFVPYEQYQRQLGYLIQRDKFFNERNTPSLQNARITDDPMEALQRITNPSAPIESSIYSVCEIPTNQHMLSISFPLMCEYARRLGIRVIGHRLCPRLAWIADAFEHYCEMHGWPVVCRKIDVKLQSGLSICDDCLHRLDHTTSTCEVCVFQAYAKHLDSSTYLYSM